VVGLWCTIRTSDGLDEDAKEQALDAVEAALSVGDCVTALDAILPFYDSESSDNSVRLATASSYGCAATVNLLEILDGLATFSGNLGGSGFWEFLAKQFPSTTTPVDDKIPQAAMNATDALMATLEPGTILVPSATINSTSNNPGSLIVSDRVIDSNSYLTFVSMALMGSLESRYGVPDASFHQTVDLPWTTATDVTVDGCAFAAALLNFNDGIASIQASSPANIAAIYGTISSFLGTILDAGCNFGCTVICGGAVTCTTCPMTLRDRNSCTSLNTDVNSCATAGLITAINGSWN
jgi:hypothetical protein